MYIHVCMHTVRYSIKLSYVHTYVCIYTLTLCTYSICVHMFLTPPFPTATVFLEYLQGCDTAEEIQGMIMTLFEEEASKAREFAGKFIEKRQKMIDVSTVHTAHGYYVCNMYVHVRMCVY